ncbi:hypothetical protein P8452_46843 [Trifolium repens]|nr:hypothetical protein P8452_46843 [Trifolium repens]
MIRLEWMEVWRLKKRHILSRFNLKNHGAGHAHLESLLIELGLARGFLGGERVFGFILSNLTRCKVSVVLGGKQ